MPTGQFEVERSFEVDKKSNLFSPHKTRGKVVSVRRCKGPQNDGDYNIVVSANEKARKNASFCEQS